MSRTGAVPRVTIGMPVYNGERYVAQSVESLLNQSYSDFVLIISDNASTDHTSEICEQYAKRDSRVHYYRNPQNIGLTRNFNRVFQLASSPYFKWATADDFWAPEMLGDAVAVLDEDACVVLCYSRTVLVDEAGREKSRYEDHLHLMHDDPAERFVALLNRIGLVNQLVGVIRSDAIGRTRLMTSHARADQTLLAELTLYGKFFELPKYQFFRRFHPDSTSWDRGSEVHRVRRFHPAGVNRTLLATTRYHFDLISSVLRAPLSIRQRVQLLRVLLRRMLWDRDRLIREWAGELTAVFRRAK